MDLPKKVTIVEVGPRDGLQNEPQLIPTNIKIEFIKRLAQTGLSVIEAGSFVSPEKIPQLKDTPEILEAIQSFDKIRFPVLVPNEQGMTAALKAGAREIAVFSAVSETFCQKNINCSIKESIERFKKVIQMAHQAKIPVRAYLSCCLGCPFEGTVKNETVALLAKNLIDLGCYQVSLGDTIGVGTPIKAQELIRTISSKIPLEKIAVHFHDTYGQAIANIFGALQCGITTIDSAVAGIGGCPYAPGATGNVATEDVVYLLNGLGIETNINLEKVIEAGNYICEYLGHEPQSKVAKALSNKEKI